MKKILAIGNALVDILIRVEDEKKLAYLGLPKGSMQLVDKQRSDSILQTLQAYPRNLAAGGSAANTAHGLGMLGVPTGYMGVIGEDGMGASFIKDMNQAGVETYMFRSKTETGRAIALITPDSERTFATYLGAAIELTTSNFKPTGTYPIAEIFKQYDYLHLEGYLVQDHDLIKAALTLADEAGLLVSMDLSSFNVVEANRSFLNEIIQKHVDILFANEEEAKAFTGFEPDQALHEISKFVEVAVVKTGCKGSKVKRGEEILEIGIIPVQPVDTTGAGDLYASGFLYGHANGFPLNKCGETGALLAGHVIEELGAKMSLKRWKRISALV